MGISDPSLAAIPPIHKERILVAYALEVSKGLNLKGIDTISSKTLKNYLRAAASHATDNGLRDPRFRYTPDGLLANGSKYFPLLEKLLSHMSKWARGRSEALPITPAIMATLHSQASHQGPNSLTSCVFDALCIGLQTGSRCSEYCKGHPTASSDAFCRVPNSHYAGAFANYPLAFIPEDISFLSSQCDIIPSSHAASDATFIRIRFKFDKGGTGNLTSRTFKRLPLAHAAYCPLLASLWALDRWSKHNLPPLSPLFCYTNNGTLSFLSDSEVTSILRQATVTTYPNSNHLYRERIKDIRTHSVQVTACLILVSAKLPTAAIEHRLRWASQAWKVYVRESLNHMDQAASTAFFTDTTTSGVDTATSIQQAYDADDLL